MSAIEAMPDRVIPASQLGLARPYKRVVLNIMADGTITSKFGVVAGSGKPPMPVTQHEWNQLKRAMAVGFRRQMLRFKRSGKPIYFKNEPEQLGDSNEPSDQHN